ncbi:MAG: TGS domain-containing protein, partial [Eubacteriales bacterium]|nr:TGS domain-containing protein [Eubacteriales bacterium]
MIITLKDGSQKECQPGVKAIDFLREISAGLARSTLAVQIDGVVSAVDTPLTQDCTLQALTFADEAGKRVYRHTASHVMAHAVKALFPDVKLAIGPATETGFYYDFDTQRTFSLGDFDAIEAEMKKIIKADLPLERFTLPRAEAIAFLRQKDEPYKVELIQDLPEDAVISFYRQGDFVDLCAGPHLTSTGMIKAFKLMSVAGAYWRGSEKNKMLQRIYATAFDKKADMDAYLSSVEEAK